jgi:hypothetical protein
MAMIAGKTAVATEPPSANSRRLPSLSAKYPENSLTKLDAPSLRPSMMPRAKTGALRMIRNEGRRTVTDSYPRSPKKLAIPAPKTVRFSHVGHFIPVYRQGIPDKGWGFLPEMSRSLLLFRASCTRSAQIGSDLAKNP